MCSGGWQPCLSLIRRIFKIKLEHGRSAWRREMSSLWPLFNGYVAARPPGFNTHDHTRIRISVYGCRASSLPRIYVPWPASHLGGVSFVPHIHSVPPETQTSRSKM